jgi:competence protein ComEC
MELKLKWIHYPFVKLLICLLVGIAVAMWLEIYVRYFYFQKIAIITASIVLLGISIISYVKQQLKHLLTYSFMLIGMLLYFSKQKPQITNDLSNHYYYGEIISHPKLKPKHQSFQIKLYNHKNYHAIIQAIYSIKTTVKKGDLIVFKGKLKSIQKREHQYETNFYDYFKRQGISAQCFIKDHELKITGHSHHFITSIENYILKIKNILEKRIKNKTSNTRSSNLLAGLLIGSRNQLDTEELNLFSTTGTIHVMAISGMHIILIYQLIIMIIKLINLSQNHWSVNVVICITIWLYISICGFSGSTVRAGIAITMILMSKVIYRNTQPVNMIAGTAFMMLWYKPNYIYDIGFALSFLAIIGIQSMNSNANNTTWSIKKYIVDNAIICLAAQLFTFPYSCYLFEQFPCYFLIANLIAIPMTTLLLFLGIGITLLGDIPIINKILNHCINLCSDILYYSLNKINDIPYASLKIRHLEFVHIILIYLIITTCIYLIYSKKIKTSYYLLCISLILFTIRIISWSKQHLNTDIYIVSHLNKPIIYMSDATNIYTNATSYKNAVKFIATHSYKHKKNTPIGLDRIVFKKNNELYCLKYDNYFVYFNQVNKNKIDTFDLKEKSTHLIEL